MIKMYHIMINFKKILEKILSIFVGLIKTCMQNLFFISQIRL